MKGNRGTGIAMIFLSLIVAFLAGKEFLKMREPEPIVKGEGVTSMQKLSDYLPFHQFFYQILISTLNSNLFPLSSLPHTVMV